MLTKLRYWWHRLMAWRESAHEEYDRVGDTGRYEIFKPPGEWMD